MHRETPKLWNSSPSPVDRPQRPTHRWRAMHRENPKQWDPPPARSDRTTPPSHAEWAMNRENPKRSGGYALALANVHRSLGGAGRRHWIMPKRRHAVRRTFRKNPKDRHRNRWRLRENQTPPETKQLSPGKKQSSPVRNTSSLRKMPIRWTMSQALPQLIRPGFPVTREMLRDIPIRPCVSQVRPATVRVTGLVSPRTFRMMPIRSSFAGRG